MTLQIETNRAAKKWRYSTQIARLLWAFMRPLYRLSPRQVWIWRRFLLRMFGAKIGANVHIYPTVRITMPWNLTIGDHTAIGDRAILYALGQIHIGQSVTISQNVHVCAGSHDYRSPNMDLLKTPITIETGVWACADAFIGPGVTISKYAIVGARAVITKSIPCNTIVAGNPAKKLGIRQFTTEPIDHAE